MSEPRIHIIGVGSDGLAGLTGQARDLLNAAEVVFGSDQTLAREAITAVSQCHPSASILIGRCVAAERGMTWWPLAELLHQLCGISLEDSAETAGAKLREGVTSILIRAGFADGECTDGNSARHLGDGEQTINPGERFAFHRDAKHR